MFGHYRTQKTMKNTTLLILGLITVLVIVAMIMPSVWERRETGQCQLWQAEAERYGDYFISNWQAEQCNARGVYIDAPVK